MTNVPKQTFLARIERWLVGLVMAAVAFMIEVTLLRSIRRGQKGPNPPNQHA